MNLRFTLIFTLCLTFISSCEEYDQDSYNEFVVVESYAVANRPLPAVRVYTTGPVNQVYDAAQAILQDANVMLSLLDNSGESEKTFEYTFNEEDGTYIPNTDDLVLARRAYELIVDFNHRDDVVRAVTTVPDDFEILNEVPGSIVYQSIEQLEIVISETVKTQNQNVFVFSSIAEDTLLTNLTPFYRATVDDGDLEISDLIINSSGLINEGNFELNEDGTITLSFPWIGVAFYGTNRIVTQSVDENLYDLVRSQQVQLGGSTLSPGEIPNVIYNTSGGIGIFGSLSSDTVTTNILRPF